MIIKRLEHGLNNDVKLLYTTKNEIPTWRTGIATDEDAAGTLSTGTPV